MNEIDDYNMRCGMVEDCDGILYADRDQLILLIRHQIEMFIVSQRGELNDDITRENIRFHISSYLSSLIRQEHIIDYMVICDESNNPPSEVDRNALHCDAIVRENNSLDVTNINFVLTP